jgi:hypothetical protein
MTFDGQRSGPVGQSSPGQESGYRVTCWRCRSRGPGGPMGGIKAVGGAQPRQTRDPFRTRVPTLHRGWPHAPRDNSSVPAMMMKTQFDG